MLHDFTSAFAALLTAIVAVVGINAWRRRLRGTTEYQVAFKVLEAVYALREAMEEARTRHAATPDRTRESPAAGAHASSGEGGDDVLVSAEAYREKLARVRVAREHLLRVQQEAFALWGEPSTDALLGIYEAAQAFHATFEQYFERALDRGRRFDRDDQVEGPDAEMQAMKRVLYVTPNEKDPFGERILRASAAAEEFYRGHIR